MFADLNEITRKEPKITEGADGRTESGFLIYISMKIKTQTLGTKGLLILKYRSCEAFRG